MAPIVKGVRRRRGERCGIPAHVGEFDYRIVFRVPEMDIGHVFCHVRHVFDKFERAAFFVRSGNEMQFVRLQGVFGKILREKYSSKRMADVRRSFRVEIRGEFFKKHLPFFVPRIPRAWKIGNQNPEAVRQFAVKRGFPAGSVFEKPNVPRFNRGKVLFVRIKGFAASYDDKGREFWHGS